MSWIVRASIALWGLAVAIGLMPRLQGKAAPDALPGALPAMGLDPSGPLHQFALIILTPFLVALAARKLVLHGWSARFAERPQEWKAPALPTVPPGPPIQRFLWSGGLLARRTIDGSAV